MSRQLRKQGMWPADELARSVWHLAASLEDAVDLYEASKLVKTSEASVAIIKKALVELASFNDVVGELTGAVASADLSVDSRMALHQALRDYNRIIEPSRKLLTDIRNTIGAHRTAQPGPPEQKKHKSTFDAWGEWEQRMLELESQCTRENWVDSFNAAIELRNIVGQYALGSWFETDSAGVKFYMPLRISK